MPRRNFIEDADGAPEDQWHALPRELSVSTVSRKCGGVTPHNYVNADVDLRE